MKPVVVFDTNVLFPAVGWHGKPAQCLQLAQDGQIDGVTCTEILNELAAKLVLRLNFSNQQVLTVLGSLMSFLRSVTISGKLKGACVDPKDDMVLECALVGRATHVVSSDRKHLLFLKQYQGIPILSPADALKVLKP